MVIWLVSHNGDNQSSFYITASPPHSRKASLATPRKFLRGVCVFALPKILSVGTPYTPATSVVWVIRWSTLCVRPVRHSQKHLAPMAQFCFFLCPRSCRWSTQCVRPRSALAKAAVLRTVFFSFAYSFCALCAEVWAIRWNARGACPCSALAETPCADGAVWLFLMSETPCADGAVWLFLMSALVQVEHAMRAPPFGTRKSSRAAHCLFFFCPPILRFVRRGVGKRKTAPSGAAFARVGLEPTRILLHRILSPARLPVSPHRRR